MQSPFVKYLLGRGEWQAFECKRAAAMPARLLEVVVAFANSDGGIFVIGLEDPDKARGDKRLVGVGENPDNVSDFLKLLDKEIEPYFDGVKKIEVPITNTAGGADILVVISISKSKDIHSLKNGDTFVRKGRQNHKIGSSEIIRLKYEKGSLKYEDEASGVSDLADVDQELLNQYQTDTEASGSNAWQFLKDGGLAVMRNKNFELTNAGALLFCINPSVALRRKCGIKISHYFGTQPIHSENPNFVRRPFTVEGPLLRQIEGTLVYFQQIAKQAPPKLSGASFRSALLIPEWVFQEAIANAVIHRNYSIQDDIHVRFFDDRIEVESPGIYPGHITVANIRTERWARNPAILRTLNRFQAAPNLDIGEGVDRMYKLMSEGNLYDPLYSLPSQRPNSVLLTFINQYKVEYWDVVSHYLDTNARITNREARSITGVRDTLIMSRLLRGWVVRGLLVKYGGLKDGYYTKPGQEDAAMTLFAEASDNKIK